MKMRSTMMAIATAAMIFSGCGGGGGSSDTASSDITGRLVDSNVSGVSYTCNYAATPTGMTDENGSFTCPPNSTVEFSIGGMTLGQINVRDGADIHPLLPSQIFYGAIDGLGNIGQQKTRNFLRVLQTLDSDHNPANGITIDQAARDALAGTTLDLAYDDLNDTAITEMLQSVGYAPVSAAAAMAHYAETLKSLGIRPMEEYESQEWHINADPQYTSVSEDADIDLNETLMDQYDGTGVKIAIIDNGFEVTHEDFASGIKGTYNAGTGTADVAPVMTQAYPFHGTAVAGIAGARVNGVGTRGVAPKSDLYLISNNGFWSSSMLIAAFDKAEAFGADVINCSFVASYTQALRDTIHNLAVSGRGGKGVVVVFGAGNANEPIDVNTTLGSYTDVITVGATASNLEKASYSNFGPAIDVVAPGGDFKGIVCPDLTGDAGLNSYQTNSDGDYNLAYGTLFVGTSAATPVVSGLAALMLQANPNLSAAQVMQILRDTADKIGNGTYIDGRNDTFGYGKINAAKAIAAAKAL